tara:strand:- start:208 stop:918 length:711 start_codon:yes stop_codon:yes gene_type:complete
MEPGIKQKFEQSEKSMEDLESRTNQSFSHSEKRIDDLKFYINSVITVCLAVFSLGGIFFTYNFSGEKDRIKDFKAEVQKDVNEFINKKGKPPKITLHTSKGTILESAQIEARVIHKKNENVNWSVYIPLVLKNSGKGKSEEITVKFYTTEPLQLKNKAAFIEGYDYEVSWQGRYSTALPNMPPNGFVSSYLPELWIVNDNDIPQGEYPVKLEVYYGQGLKEEAEFKVLIKQNLTSR